MQLNSIEQIMRDAFLPVFEHTFDVTILRGTDADREPSPDRDSLIVVDPMRATNPRTGEVLVETVAKPYATYTQYDSDVCLKIDRILAFDEYPHIWCTLVRKLEQITEWAHFVESNGVNAIFRSAYSVQDLRAMCLLLGVIVPTEVPRLATAILLARAVVSVLESA